MYITGERGGTSLLVNSIRTWSTPELMMKHLWNEYILKLEELNKTRKEYAQTYKFETFLDSTYQGIRVYFSPTNQDERPKLLKGDDLADIAKLLKYIS